MIQERLFTMLLIAFGGLALFIACIGIYGMTIYMVRHRTAEIGIRMSLGAQRLDVIRLIIRETLGPVAVGLGIGILAAFAESKLVASALFRASVHTRAQAAARKVLSLIPWLTRAVMQRS